MKRSPKKLQRRRLRAPDPAARAPEVVCIRCDRRVRRVRVDFRLKPETVLELTRMAETEGLTRTEVIERLLGLCCPGYACWVCGSHGMGER